MKRERYEMENKTEKISKYAPRPKPEAIFELNFTNGMVIRWYVSWDNVDVLKGMCDRATNSTPLGLQTLEFGVNSEYDTIRIPAMLFRDGLVYYRQYDREWWENNRCPK